MPPAWGTLVEFLAKDTSDIIFLKIQLWTENMRNTKMHGQKIPQKYRNENFYLKLIFFILHGNLIVVFRSPFS